MSLDMSLSVSLQPAIHRTLWLAQTMCILVANNHNCSYVNRELTNSKYIWEWLKVAGWCAVRVNKNKTYTSKCDNCDWTIRLSTFSSNLCLTFDLFFQNVQREVTRGQMDEGLGPEVKLPSPSLMCQEMPLKVHVGKSSKGEFHNFGSTNTLCDAICKTGSVILQS